MFQARKGPGKALRPKRAGRYLGGTARGRGKRSQPGLRFEDQGDHCGFSWKRERFTGGFADLLEPRGRYLSRGDNTGT